jgi:hypothetical protein
MTEEEWLDADQPSAMIEFVTEDRLLGTDRKLRLAACAFCRRHWKMLPDPRSRRMVEVAEDYADGLASAERLSAVQADAIAATGVNYGEWQSIHGSYLHAANAAWWLGQVETPFDVGYVADKCFGVTVCDPDDPEEEDPFQAELLRDVFGNPLQPVAFDPDWKSGDVVALARAIYDDRAFDRLPILADALIDAGCDDEQILEHCRGPGPHVRGCWVVDLVLGKE